MTREEILGALNEMFPDGIPDSCNEIMTREDAPFKSYQELRKALSRSPAYTNSANWKALTAGEEGGEVVPPKPKLEATWSISPSLIGRGAHAKTSMDIKAGAAIGSRLVVPAEHQKFIKVTKEAGEKGIFTLDIIAAPTAEDGNTAVIIGMYVTDSADNKEKFLGNQKLTIVAE